MIDTKEMEKLPEGWKRIKLGKVLDYEQPINYIVKSENYDQKSGIPVLTAGKTFILGYTDETEGVFKDVPVIIFDDFTTESKFINFSFKVKSSALKILKLGYDRNNIYFLYNAMQILNFNPGSEHKRYWISEYSNTVIPLPSLPEQEKIAEILETVDNTIEKTDAIIEKYKRIKQGLVQELLTKGIDKNWEVRSEKTHKFKDSPLGRIPEEWEVKRLGEVAEIKGGKRLPKTTNFSEFKTPYPYIRLTDIKNMTIDTENLMYISQDVRNIIKKYTVSAKDIIISIAGTIGLIAIIPSKLNGANLTENASKITNFYNINAWFLAYYLSFQKVQNIISEFMGVVAQPKLAIFRVKQLPVALPPVPEQHRIASILSQVDAVIEKETAYRDKLSRIKQGLMEDLLTGKVRVTTLLENNTYQKEAF